MQLKNILRLECMICGANYSLPGAAYVCPKHGNDGILDVVIDLEYARRWISREALAENNDPSMWRYAALLPVDPECMATTVGRTVLRSVGWTPLIPVPALSARIGLSSVWIKDDGRQPTASLKDRASAIAIIKARESRSQVITAASTGNAAAALSGLCAAVSQMNVLFVPRTAPEAKIAQLLVYGSTVFLVDGTYDDAYDLCMQAAAEFGWYNRNTGYNPYMTEGKKTAAYEICEQLGWNAPDYILVPVGDGCIIGGIDKGLRELHFLGWIRKMPRLIGVQAEGSAALADAWSKGMAAAEMKPIRAKTVADSISAGLPRDSMKALRAVRESKGAFVTVSDDEIIAAIPALARECGIFAEPAAAAAYAGLFKAVGRGIVGSGKTAVVLVTGSGLKDPTAAAKSVAQPIAISPDLAEVRRAMAL